MPYYLIEFTTKSGNKFSGVREVDNHDIDYVYTFFKQKAENKYKITSYSCVMLSKHCQLVHQYIKKTRKPPREDGGPTLGERASKK